jgi:peroxiredoxin
MKRAVFLFTTLFALAVVASAQGLPVGSAMENFSLPDLNGNTQTLGGLRGQKGAVVIFLSADCPAVKAYKDRINQIAAEARTKGINFIGINSNSTDSPNGLRSNASQFGYRFPILIDQANRLADRLDARTAPEVYFVSRENVLLYRGAIDNERTGRNVTENYLTAAFEASLAGRPVAKTSVAPFGCTIRRARM